MANGITMKMRELSRQMSYRLPTPWVPKKRDRSLSGKARVAQRKLDNKKQ